MKNITMANTLMKTATSLIHPCTGLPNINYSSVNNSLDIGFTTPSDVMETPADFWRRWRGNLASVYFYFTEHGLPVDEATITTNFADLSGYVRFTCQKGSFDHFLEPKLFFASTTREFSKDLSSWTPMED